MQDTVGELEDSLCARGDREIVGDDDEGGVVFSGDGFKEFHDQCAGFGVECAGGLVGEDDSWLVDKGTCDGDALLFATRHLGGVGVEAIAEPHAVEHGSGKCATPPKCLSSCVEQWDFNVFNCRARIENVELLEHEAEG